MSENCRRHGSSSRGRPTKPNAQNQQPLSGTIADGNANELTWPNEHRAIFSATPSSSASPSLPRYAAGGELSAEMDGDVTPREGAFLRPGAPSATRGVVEQPLKVAIPRIRRDSEATNSTLTGGDKHRISHACEPCRHRKVKCSGDKPVCQHCRDFDIVCVYGDGKRDKFKRDYARLVTENAGYEQLLRDLIMRVSLADRASIRKILQPRTLHEEEVPQSPRSLKRSLTGSDQESGDEAQGEKGVSGGVGSNESGDILNEDLNKTEETRATGYIGKNSEIAWLRQLQQEVGETEMDKDIRAPGPYGPPGDSDAAGAARLLSSRDRRKTEGPPTRVSQSTYQCDDIDILIQDQVDPYQIPAKETAERLLQCYLDTVHDDFPILGRSTFIGQFQKYFDALEDGSPMRLPHKWRAILNLVFAIGAKFSQLTKAPWRGDDRDHLIYFTRARMLGMHGDSIINHADLQQIQIAAMLAFYLSCINQISRAWNINGIALRCCFALGLNLRNEDQTIAPAPKEVRVRVWWAVYSLECLLGVMTGRPVVVTDTSCTTPLPVPFLEDVLSGPMGQMHLDNWSFDNISIPDSRRSAIPNAQPGQHSSVSSILVRQSLPAANVGLYFRFQIQLCLIIQQVTELYSAGTVRKSWEGVQKLIQDLDEKLQTWKNSLPPAYDFTKRQSQQFRREKMALGLAYWSARILISRPCVCRVDSRIQNQTNRSKAFNHRWAQICVHAARDMVEMMPDQPNLTGIYKVAPWWCLLHYLMQAATVLMLELTFQVMHMPEEASEVQAATIKVVNWLQKMGEDSMAAHRAWKLSTDTLLKMAATSDFDFSGLYFPKTDNTDGMQVDSEEAQVPSASYSARFQQPQQDGQAALGFGFRSQPYYGGPSQGNVDNYLYPMYTSYDQFLPFLRTQDSKASRDGEVAASTQAQMQNPQQAFAAEDWLTFFNAANALSGSSQ